MKEAVIISGVNGGIGQALVRTFDDAGFDVIGTDRTAEPVDDLACAFYVSADLQKVATDDDYAATIFGVCREWLGQRPLKGLVNNAAVQVLGGVETLTRSDWHRTLDVNLVAPFLWSQAFLSELTAAAGSIVNISSIHSQLTKRNFVAYATSKAALSGMTRAMSIDLGDKVRINAIEPAAIETEMLKAGFEGAPELFEQLEQHHPRNHIGQPDEVARLALFMVREKMDFLHGSCIGLNGGISGRLHDPDG